VVVTEANQIDQWAARRHVRSLGVDEETLSQTVLANPELDWLQVIYALDRVFLSYGGTIAQARFMRQSQLALAGRTPIETLPEVGGPDRVCRAAHVFAATAP
jgi:hypothetical protein